jgi:hypothetical protein
VPEKEILSLFKHKIHLTETKKKDNIYYFIREPNIRINNTNEEELIKYLELMEGNADKIVFDNHCFQGQLILDGSFEIPLKYNDKIEIKAENNKILTI